MSLREDRLVKANDIVPKDKELYDETIRIVTIKTTPKKTFWQKIKGCFTGAGEKKPKVKQSPRRHLQLWSPISESQSPKTSLEPMMVLVSCKLTAQLTEGRP